MKKIETVAKDLSAAEHHAPKDARAILDQSREAKSVTKLDKMQHIDSFFHSENEKTR